MSLKVHDEGAPVGDHQANGAAEVTVQLLRAKAGLLIQQVEDKVAGGKVIFGVFASTLQLGHHPCRMVTQQVCGQWRPNGL